jgi:hypothetical protein
MMPAVADTVELGLDDLKPHPQNARTHDLAVIRESLERHGQFRAIVARRAGRGRHTILAGHGTWEAARELGWDRILVHLIDCDAEQAKRILLVDNRANDHAGYDQRALLDLLGGLPDLDGTGYDDDAVADLDALVQRLEAAERPSDDAPPLPAEPTTKPGDLYQLGEHRLLCGDSTVATHVERLMGDVTAEVLWSDPPYGVEYVGKTADALTIKPSRWRTRSWPAARGSTLRPRRGRKGQTFGSQSRRWAGPSTRRSCGSRTRWCSATPTTTSATRTSSTAGSLARDESVAVITTGRAGAATTHRPPSSTFRGPRSRPSTRR